MLSITADALPRYMQCFGHVQMPESFPPEAVQNTVREEGIAAHYMASAVYDPKTDFGDTSELVDRKAPNGVYMTPEIADAVDLYLSHILTRKPYDFSEMETDASWATIRGRADHIGFAAGILYVDDAKFGYRIEEPENNLTLISHAIGWCESRRYVPGEVVLTIIQPRAYHRLGKIREFRLSYDQLMGWRDTIYAALETNDRTLRTGPNCYGCKALANCHAAKDASFNALDAIGAVHHDEMPNDVLADMLDTFENASKILKGKLEALQEMATYRVKNGANVPNYHIEPAVGNLTWNDGIDTNIVHALTGIDPRKSAIKTPTQLKTLGVSEEMLKAITHRPPRGTKLIRESDTARAKRIMGK